MKKELRDLYAAAALQGLMQRSDAAGFNFQTHPSDALRVACWAFEAADAMLQVRNATPREICELFAQKQKANRASK